MRGALFSSLGFREAAPGTCCCPSVLGLEAQSHRRFCFLPVESSDPCVPELEGPAGAQGAVLRLKLPAGPRQPHPYRRLKPTSVFCPI